MSGSSSEYEPPSTELAPTEAIIICNRCRSPFNAKRETPRERFNSHRCRWCGEEHTPSEIICDREPIEEYGGYSPSNNPTVLYIIKAENGLLKVGIASQFERRLSSMRSNSASPIDVLATFNTDYAREIESEIHDELVDKNSHGEWFNLSERSHSGFVDSVSMIVDKHESQYKTVE